MSEIEYFYSAHSAYAYLGSARLMQIAQAATRRIAHRPMDLRKVVAVTGPGSTNGLTPERRSYFSGREIERWAEFRAAPVMQGIPTYHDKNMTLSNGMLIAGLLQGIDIDQLAHCMLEAHWRDDADLADKKTLSQLGKSAGVDPGPLLDAALSPQVQAVYASNTEEAINRSVFGSPTYFVDGDMFYGQDHLEMVERALERPFAGPWPRS
ncbi:MAG: 2-hydroxychromene-2-carboxylate isomerase [Gammaproteobacteria bacterium]|jgi:2-hydroxychromene-2-carboxylate isomerase|nr:2-hydroxychromene-2-carboxylate isomerase [Gammaproteobacteria bacterium]NCF80217.1 2-hydroxychromene-2-carboxylate isomerase [Pseudomonadota bacterium]